MADRLPWHSVLSDGRTLWRNPAGRGVTWTTRAQIIQWAQNQIHRFGNRDIAQVFRELGEGIYNAPFDRFQNFVESKYATKIYNAKKFQSYCYD